MRRQDIVSRTLLTLTVITFAIAAPVLVQEKRQACADEGHVPRDVITVLGKRATGDDLHMLWDGPWRFGSWLGEPEVHVPEEHAPPPNIAGVRVPKVPVSPPDPAGVPAPPPELAGVHVPEGHAPLAPPDLAEEHVAEMHASPSNQAGVHVPGVDMPTDGPWHSGNVLGGAEGHGAVDDALPAIPKSGHSLSPPMSPQSTKSEEWHMVPSNLESDSEAESDHWSMVSNAPSVESQHDNPKAADAQLVQSKGKAKVLPRISGTAGGVDVVNAAQMELRSAVDPINIPPPL